MLFHLSSPIRIAQRITSAVALETYATGQSNANLVLREIYWGIAWLADIFHRCELKTSHARAECTGSVMEALVTALRPAKLQQPLFEVANTIAHHLRCSRAVIGTVENQTAKVKALSNATLFENNTALICIDLSRSSKK